MFKEYLTIQVSYTDFRRRKRSSVLGLNNKEPLEELDSFLPPSLLSNKLGTTTIHSWNKGGISAASLIIHCKYPKILLQTLKILQTLALLGYNLRIMHLSTQLSGFWYIHRLCNYHPYLIPEYFYHLKKKLHIH